MLTSSQFEHRKWYEHSFNLSCGYFHYRNTCAKTDLEVLASELKLVFLCQHLKVSTQLTELSSAHAAVRASISSWEVEWGGKEGPVTS